jgi:hypothetical protein
VTQAAAAAKATQRTDLQRTANHHHFAVTLESRLERKLAASRKEKSVIRFFARHHRLLASMEHGAVARKILRRAKHHLAHTMRQIAELRRAIRVRKERLLTGAPPKAAICGVFGGDCKEAVAVAWCESRLRTTAHNGEYLGLFQMGSFAREVYGHGPTARAQAVAAHRYFVSSGRDWSPWSCKPTSGF